MEEPISQIAPEHAIEHPPVSGNDIPNPSGYADLTPDEQEYLLMLYNRYNGRISQLMLDSDCPYKAHSHLTYYKQKYDLHEKSVKINLKRQQEVTSRLQDAKMRAIEQAERFVEPNQTLVFTKTGMQIFDPNGKPLIIERLPHFKELQIAWNIIKTELGEPVTINKTELKGGEGGLFLTGALKLEIVNADDKTATGNQDEPAPTPGPVPA